jgi:hypothetical protein
MEQSHSTLLALPIELVIIIFEYLTYYDAIRLILTCTKTKGIILNSFTYQQAINDNITMRQNKKYKFIVNGSKCITLNKLSEYGLVEIKCTRDNTYSFHFLFYNKNNLLTYCSTLLFLVTDKLAELSTRQVEYIGRNTYNITDNQLLLFTNNSNMVIFAYSESNKQLSDRCMTYFKCSSTKIKIQNITLKLYDILIFINSTISKN